MSENPDLGFPIMGKSDRISNNDAVSNKDLYKGKSCGVDTIRISRIPANIKVVRG